MMKKEYIEPSVKAVEIKLNQILAGSIVDEVTGTKVNPNADPVTEEEGMDGFHADFEDAF